MLQTAQRCGSLQVFPPYGVRSGPDMTRLPWVRRCNFLFKRLAALPEFGDFAEEGFVDDFDAATVYEEYLLGYEVGEGADCV